MLHLEERHDLKHISCDCGNLSITLETRGRIPERMLRCGHCGASASTHELEAQNETPPPAMPEPGLTARLRKYLFGPERKRQLSGA